GSTGNPPGITCNTGTIDSPFIPNQKVSITNLNPYAFTDLWYVADPQTNASNLDGAVNGFPAFKIDQVGVNKPLISESIITDGIFDPGETWVFLIQDFANNTLPASLPSAFASIGVGPF